MIEEKTKTFPLLLTVQEAASELGISRSTIYELIRSKRLEVVKIGRSTRLPTIGIANFVESLRQSDAQRA